MTSLLNKVLKLGDSKMATIRATVNEFGFYSLDVKFDLVGTDNAFEMVKGLISQTISDYNPSDEFWKGTKQEVLKEGYSYHYWGEKIVSLYYDKEGTN